MGTKFAHYDAAGNIVAFTEDGKFDAPSIEISFAEWQDCLNNPGRNLVVNGALNIAPPPTLDRVKMAQIALINEKCQTELSAIVLPYPPDEPNTWPNQYAEAQSYSANNAVQTPMLSAISAASGQTVAALAASVLAKAGAYNAAAGAAVGKRQRLTAQIMAIKDTDANPVDAVRAIVW